MTVKEPVPLSTAVEPEGSPHKATIFADRAIAVWESRIPTVMLPLPSFEEAERLIVLSKMIVLDPSAYVIVKASPLTGVVGMVSVKISSRCRVAGGGLAIVPPLMSMTPFSMPPLLMSPRMLLILAGSVMWLPDRFAVPVLDWLREVRGRLKSPI